MLLEAFVPLTKEEKADVSLAFSDSSRYGLMNWSFAFAKVRVFW